MIITHINQCVLKNRIQLQMCYPKSFNELLNRVNIEKYHRNKYNNLGKTIRELTKSFN